MYELLVEQTQLLICENEQARKNRENFIIHAIIQRPMIEDIKNLILAQLTTVAEDELLQFIAFLKFRKEQTETHLASQATLAKDWLNPEEDQAWQHL